MYRKDCYSTMAWCCQINNGCLTAWVTVILWNKHLEVFQWLLIYRPSALYLLAVEACWVQVAVEVLQGLCWVDATSSQEQEKYSLGFELRPYRKASTPTTSSDTGEIVAWVEWVSLLTVTEVLCGQICDALGPFLAPTKDLWGQLNGKQCTGWKRIPTWHLLLCARLVETLTSPTSPSFSLPFHASLLLYIAP